MFCLRERERERERERGGGMLASNVRHWTLLVFIKLNYVLPERERRGGGGCVAYFPAAQPQALL